MPRAILSAMLRDLVVVAPETACEAALGRTRSDVDVSDHHPPHAIQVAPSWNSDRRTQLRHPRNRRTTNGRHFHQGSFFGPFHCCPGARARRPASHRLRQEHQRTSLCHQASPSVPPRPEKEQKHVSIRRCDKKKKQQQQKNQRPPEKKKTKQKQITVESSASKKGKNVVPKVDSKCVKSVHCTE